ncbi:MAG: hypothetical protein ACKPIF_00835, partial [Microcystis panniformis]
MIPVFDFHLKIERKVFPEYTIKKLGVVRSEEERCNAPVLIRSIFPFDNADCRANSGISPTPIVGLIPLLNRAILVPHLSPTIGTI